MIRLVLLVVLAAMAFGFQEPEGTAVSCNNFRLTLHKCACAKAKMCGRGGHGSAEPDNKCKTFCRPQACSCIGPCTSRGAK